MVEHAARTLDGTAILCGFLDGDFELLETLYVVCVSLFDVCEKHFREESASLIDLRPVSM